MQRFQVRAEYDRDKDVVTMRAADFWEAKGAVEHNEREQNRAVELIDGQRTRIRYLELRIRDQRVQLAALEARNKEHTVVVRILSDALVQADEELIEMREDRAPTTEQDIEPLGTIEQDAERDADEDDVCQCEMCQCRAEGSDDTKANAPSLIQAYEDWLNDMRRSGAM